MRNRPRRTTIHLDEELKAAIDLTHAHQAFVTGVRMSQPDAMRALFAAALAHPSFEAPAHVRERFAARPDMPK
jgi:hypothetical protein